MGNVPANFHGKKGRSGRKSLHEERRSFDVASQMLFKKIDLEKMDQVMIKLKNKKGKVSIQEVMMIKALAGSERLIQALADKVMASKHTHQIGKSVSQLLSETNDPGITS